MSRICLVSCASSKLPCNAKAKDIYISPLFQYARKVAERDYDKWYILSALHGLLEPEKQIAPYNETLNRQNIGQKKKWATGVLKKLRAKLKRGDSITFLAGDNYRDDLIPKLTALGYVCNAPLEGLGLGQQIHTLKLLVLHQDRLKHLNRFYDILERLRDTQGQIALSKLEGSSKLPLRGVYFFFEPGEKRLFNCSCLRCVRVGTHAVSRNATSTLWTRLRTHRGSSDWGGNHRSSIFRLHVGAAMLARGDLPVSLTTWGKEQDAPIEVRKKERSLEEAVSRFIGNMQVLWIEIPDEPGPMSDRAFIEQNSIVLLSGSTGPLDLPSRNWLGLNSIHETIRKSGLWNVNYVDLDYDHRFLDVLATYVDGTIGQKSPPQHSIAPAGWASALRERHEHGQLHFFEKE